MYCKPLTSRITALRCYCLTKTDLKQFGEALSDYNLVLDMMKADGAENGDGTARYSEYVSVYAFIRSHTFISSR
jgi:hypothetical protein